MIPDVKNKNIEQNEYPEHGKLCKLGKHLENVTVIINALNIHDKITTAKKNAHTHTTRYRPTKRNSALNSACIFEHCLHSIS